MFGPSPLQPSTQGDGGDVSPRAHFRVRLRFWDQNRGCHLRSCKERDTQQRLVDDRRALLRLCLDQLSAAMSPPEGEPQRITAHAVWRNQVRVAAIGIDLDRAVESVLISAAYSPLRPGRAPRRTAKIRSSRGRSPRDSYFRPAAPRIQTLEPWSYLYRAVQLAMSSVTGCSTRALTTRVIKGIVTAHALLCCAYL